jgi:hypothetical protein
MREVTKDGSTAVSEKQKRKKKKVAADPSEAINQFIKKQLLRDMPEFNSINGSSNQNNQRSNKN